MASGILDIKTNKKIYPQIYSYSLPQVRDYDGYEKIGYTTLQNVEERIWQQLSQSGLDHHTNWANEARFNGGGYFIDDDFHTYIEQQGVRRVETHKGEEWFDFNPEHHNSKAYFKNFVFKEIGKNETIESDYTLRTEQEKAVRETSNYFRRHPNEIITSRNPYGRETSQYKKGKEYAFLWNAKPRFGKTLTSYDLIREMDCERILILTYRPAVVNSWYDDFNKFLAWRNDPSYVFITRLQTVQGKRKVFMRDDFIDYDDALNHNEIYFSSIQYLQDSRYFNAGGASDKAKWLTELNFDLVIIDESHEGIDTKLTQTILNQLSYGYILHLSGTPFKQIAKGVFEEDQIYNWSYVDEQKAKLNWDANQAEGDVTHNPYEELPQMKMYTYRMSDMILEKAQEGAYVDGEDNIDYMFNLHEFFRTDASNEFVYKEDIQNFIVNLRSNEKYPFSTPELRDELKHTFWLMDRVDSAKALAKMLKKDEVFKDYKIIEAVGQTVEEDYDGEKNDEALERVRKAIKENEKTITLSVGQLTTGITIPEWSATLMLSTTVSPARYMQAAFRAQNPYHFEHNGNYYQKERSYVFDFSPDRTLGIIDSFANDLFGNTALGGGTVTKRKENIRELLNFLPVIGEDTDGTMVELNAEQVLTIPAKVRSREVVKSGFMSNLLFDNISGLFNAPKALQALFEKMPQAEGPTNFKDQEDFEEAFDDVSSDLDDNGEPKTDEEDLSQRQGEVFGKPVYSDETDKAVEEGTTKSIVDQFMDDNHDVFDIYREKEEKTRTKADKAKKRVKEKLITVIDRQKEQEQIDKNHRDNHYESRLRETKDEKEQELIIEQREEERAAKEKHDKEVKETLEKVFEEETGMILKEDYEDAINKNKATVEQDFRARLRGFARTIPSFIMAYGTRNLRIDNFDEFVPENTFIELTGITLSNFRFMRDGGYYRELEDGTGEYIPQGDLLTANEEEYEHYTGGVFHEAVFNESIQEFLNKKDELSDYYKNTNETIFDYIPPQKTNQIYTPKHVAKFMVDSLEEDNPGIYDNPGKTFIDLYMKSGLYITEIVQRLFNSEKIQSFYPDEEERLKHILENQVYGLAPTEIIYRIATNFIFSNEKTKNISRKNFVQFDSYPYAKDDMLEEKLDELFK